MARKTAMGKEPGNVSIALPQSEKDRLLRAGGFQPGDKGMAQKILEGAKKTPLKRLSPGVYRNGAGQLVGSKGQSLPGQKPQSLTERALNAANRASGLQQNQNRPAAPAPQQQAPMSQEQLQAGLEASGLAGLLANQQNMGNQFQPNMPMSQNPFNGFRAIKPFERAHFGIDPRDPNQYEVGPDGVVRGTLMGWSPNMNTGPVQPLLNRMAPQQPQQQQQQPQQPGSVSGLLQRYR